MLNRKYAIAAMLTGLTILSTAIPVAAEMKFSSACLNQNGVYVIVGQSSDCNIPGVPDINLPEFPETPEQPEIPELPGTPEQPEIPENNSFAMQIIELVNQEREKEGLPAVQYDSNIEKAALVRAKETETSFSHTRPNGSSFSTALKENGVSFPGRRRKYCMGTEISRRGNERLDE